MKRGSVPVPTLVLILSTSWAAAQLKEALKCDEVVKNPVGYALSVCTATEEECKGLLDDLYKKAVDQADTFCKRWYECPEEWPLYYAPGLGKDKACGCSENLNDCTEEKPWLGVCDLTFNGVCGCRSPSDNPSLSMLDAALTPLERDQVTGWYPVASANLASLMRPLSDRQRSEAIGILAASLEAYRNGEVFRAEISSTERGLELEVFLRGDLAASVHGREQVARVGVRADGDSTLQESGGLPPGVRRGLFTALALAFDALEREIGAAPAATR